MTALPLDPALPAGFYDTPNDERSEQELAQWWEKPYASTNPDGTLSVRCLDGGAWDRPTFYGQAATMEQACLLAEGKLARWRWLGQQPLSQLGEHAVAMVVMPRLPRQERVVLAEFALGDQAGASAWLEEWRKRHPEPHFDATPG